MSKLTILVLLLFSLSCGNKTKGRAVAKEDEEVVKSSVHVSPQRLTAQREVKQGDGLWETFMNKDKPQEEKKLQKPAKDRIEAWGVDTIVQKEPSQKSKKLRSKKSIVKDKPKSMNKKEIRRRFLFTSRGMTFIKKWEMGKGPPCHWDKHDRGALTCIGVAIAHNEKFFLDFINSHILDCKTDHTGRTVCPDIPTPKRYIRDFYYKNYYYKYDKCGFNNAMILTDSSITSGHGRAIRLLQKSHKLKVDGLWGPQSLKACQKMNKKAYFKAERARYKSLKQCPRYCKGWLNRVNDKEKTFH